MKLLVLRGRVVRGEGLGRKLGFPTANLKVSRQRLPPFGVYKVLVSGSSWAGQRPGACNVGIRPTLAGARRPQVEVHIPGFKGNLYGRTLELVFLRLLRKERKFASLPALKAQIRRDVRRAA